MIDVKFSGFPIKTVTTLYLLSRRDFVFVASCNFEALFTRRCVLNWNNVSEGEISFWKSPKSVLFPKVIDREYPLFIYARSQTKDSTISIKKTTAFASIESAEDRMSIFPVDWKNLEERAEAFVVEELALKSLLLQEKAGLSQCSATADCPGTSSSVSYIAR